MNKGQEQMRIRLSNHGGTHAHRARHTFAAVQAVARQYAQRGAAVLLAAQPAEGTLAW